MDEKFKKQYREGRLRAEDLKSKPESFLESLSPSEKKARREGFYEAKNELKQKDKNEIRDSLASSRSESYEFDSSGSGSVQIESFGTHVAVVFISSVVGALVVWQSWLALTAVSVGSLFWFISIIGLIFGSICLIPIAAIVLCLAIILAAIALLLFIAYLLIMLIIAIVSYFWNNMY